MAQACRLALEAPLGGAEHCIIAAADTVMAGPSRELMAECFPSVPLAAALGKFETLQSNAKAQRLLGYVPRIHRRLFDARAAYQRGPQALIVPPWDKRGQLRPH